MGVWILTDPDNRRSVLYDSVSETAFGHGFIGANCQEQAEAFLQWCPCDPRGLTLAELEECQVAFLKLDTHPVLAASAIIRYSGRDQAIRDKSRQRFSEAHAGVIL